MHIAILAGQHDRAVWEQSIRICADNRACAAKTDFFDSGPQLLYTLRQSTYDAVIVVQPGAEGMETVFGVREQSLSMPLVWVSDDCAFGPLSYRLQVRMFLVRPVTQAQAADALTRCLDEKK